MTAEELRLHDSRDRKSHWKRWGPYLSERAWGTVRENHSPSGTALGGRPARSCALQGVSLERGWNRRDLRPSPKDLLRVGAVEAPSSVETW